MNTITLPDGYNGHTVECDTTPIAEDGNMVKLRVTGSSHLITWIRREEWEALTKETPAANPDEALRAWSDAYRHYTKVNHDEPTSTADQQAAMEKVVAAMKTYALATTCQHPPRRLFSWYAGDVLCICCNDCGAVLRGGVE